VWPHLQFERVRRTQTKRASFRRAASRPISSQLCSPAIVTDRASTHDKNESEFCRAQLCFVSLRSKLISTSFRFMCKQRIYSGPSSLCSRAHPIEPDVRIVCTDKAPSQTRSRYHHHLLRLDTVAHPIVFRHTLLVVIRIGSLVNTVHHVLLPDKLFPVETANHHPFLLTTCFERVPV
jgi:hypothetical protein